MANTLGMECGAIDMTRYKRRLVERKENKKIALERIFLLFKMARKAFDLEPGLAQNYVNTARKIGMRYKVRVPTEFGRMICRHCKRFLVPGKNCTIRIRQEREPHLVTTCFYCHGHMRIPLKHKEGKMTQRTVDLQKSA
ncbi:MAG: ribonuclease P protein component 4 [Candidatus Bathyarchaeota archaeon]